MLTISRIFVDMIDWGRRWMPGVGKLLLALEERSFKIRATPIIFSPVSVQVAARKAGIRSSVCL